MKKMMKKGFTLVELVIVIAVIAILAVILIPTFSSLIRKANVSSDAVLAKNLNTAVSIYKYENGKLDITFVEAMKAANDQGYVLANLNAKTEGCYFVWDDQYNQFLLIEETNDGDGYKVLHQLEDNYYVYKNGKGEENKNWCFGTSDNRVVEYLCGTWDEITKTYIGGKYPEASYLSVATDITSLKSFVNQADDRGETKIVYLDEGVDITKLTDNETFRIDNPNANVSLVLGETKVTRDNNNTFVFDVVEGTLNIEGGKISGGAWGEQVSINNDGILNMNGTTVSGGSINLMLGGTTTLNHCVISNESASSNYKAPIYSEQGTTKIYNSKVTGQKHGFFLSNGAVVEVYSGVFTAKNYVFYVNNLSKEDHTSSSNDVCGCPWTTVKIYDGNFSVPAGQKIFYLHHSGSKVHNLQVYIYGGVFKIGDKSITVNERTSNDEISKLFADGVIVEKIEDGKGFRVYRYS